MTETCARPTAPGLLRRIFQPVCRQPLAAQRLGSTDEELFERVYRGDDHAAFDELLTRYRVRVTALVRRMLSASQTAVDPDDVAQEAFIEAYRKRGTFRSGAQLRPWLYSIAVNRCLNHLRSLRQEFASEFNEEVVSVSALDDGGGDPSGIVIRRMEAADLEQAASLLPPKLRAVLILRYLDDMTYEEIAESCRIPVGTVKTQLFRARAELKRRMISREQ